MNPRRFVVSAVILAAIGARFASAQTPANVIVAAGNGQLICNLCTSSGGGPFFFQPIYALVTDANGNPISNYPVTWTASGSGAVYIPTTNTDNTGTASAQPYLFLNNGELGTYYQQFTVTAQAGSITSSPFTETDASVGSNQTQLVFAYFDNPPGATAPLYSTLSGKAGSTGTPFTIQISGQAVVPGVAVRLVNADGSSGPSTTAPSLYCQTGPAVNGSIPNPWSVLTDNTGTAQCTPVFGPVAGTARVAIEIGGLAAGEWNVLSGQGSNPAFNPYNPGGVACMVAPDGSCSLQSFNQSGFNITINVTAPTVGSVTATSGNNQSAVAGNALPSSLVATVKDTSGNPLANQQVTWTYAAGAVQLSSTTVTTNSLGQASTNAAFTSTASGTVTITATSGSHSATFTETAVVLATVSTLTKALGDGQSAVVGAAFPTPLEVQVAVSSGSPANIPVSFSVSGPATLSTSSASTNSSGIATVTATAGSTPGNVTVTASVGSMTVTFSLTVATPVVFTASSFVNGADQQKGSISACGLATLAASGVAPAVAGTLVAPLAGPLPYQLGNVTVTFNGSDAAPLLSVSANAITFLAPCDLSAGSVPVTVNTSGASATVNVTLLAASPGIFQTVQSDGVLRAVIERPDGSFASPSHPALLGENVTAFVTGLGAVSPSVSTNALPIPGSASTVNGQVIVGVNNGGTQVLSSQLSPTQPGVFLVTFQIPQTAPQGSEVVQLQSGAESVPFSVGLVPVGASAANYSAGSQIPIQ